MWRIEFTPQEGKVFGRLVSVKAETKVVRSLIHAVINLFEIFSHVEKLYFCNLKFGTFDNLI